MFRFTKRFALVLCLVYIAVTNGLVVTNPCCTTLPHQVGGFGVLLPVRETDTIFPDVIESVDGEVQPVEGHLCNSSAVNVTLTGKIALVPRGECSFASKVVNSQELGAVAVIVYETDSRKGTRTVRMTRKNDGLGAATIPSVFISYVVYQELLLDMNLTSSLEVVLNATGSVLGEVPIDESRIAIVVVASFAGFLFATVVMFGIWYAWPEYEWAQPFDNWRNISIGGHRHPSMLMAMDHSRERSRTQNPRYSQNVNASDRSLINALNRSRSSSSSSSGIE